MKKKHVLILFTVLALSVTSVMKLVPVSKVAASSILGGNKNESILDKLTPTPEPGKSDKNEKDDSNVLGEKDSLSTNMTDSLTDLMNNLLSRVGDEEYSLLTKVLSQTDDDLIEDDSDTDDGDKDDEKKASINRVVYIGDSRTEGLRDVNSDSKNTFICLSSMGCDWMLSTAFPQAESYASSGTAFVILMGVNDLYHQNSYISAINQKAAEWKKKGAVVYFASVGPVQNDPYTSNSEIESFNRALKNGFSSDVGYIDLYGELNKSGLNMVKKQEADAFVSSGSTGAVLVGGQVLVGRSKGVERPPLAPLIPTTKGVSLLIDCGANVDARPSHLVQFAKMGSIYMENVVGIKNPKVAIVNNGAEEEKGNALVKETFPLLKECKSINFIGSIEARDIPAGYADVVVCEAFVGNVILKLYEGVGSALVQKIKEGMMTSTRSKIGALLVKPALKETLKSFDATEYGGAPLLGLKGLVVKTHGSAKAIEIKHGIFQCVQFKQEKINEKIAERILEDQEVLKSGAK